MSSPPPPPSNGLHARDREQRPARRCEPGRGVEVDGHGRGRQAAQIESVAAHAGVVAVGARENVALSRPSPSMAFSILRCKHARGGTHARRRPRVRALFASKTGNSTDHPRRQRLCPHCVLLLRGPPLPRRLVPAESKNRVKDLCSPESISVAWRRARLRFVRRLAPSPKDASDQPRTNRPRSPSAQQRSVDRGEKLWLCEPSARLCRSFALDIVRNI